MAKNVIRVPPRFQGATLDSIDDDLFPTVAPWIAKVEKEGCAIKKMKGFIFSGPPGVGKTWTMAALTSWWAPKGDYEFVTAPDLFERYSIFGDAENGEGKSVDTYRGKPYNQTVETVPWLVINDLGKEYRGGKMAELNTHKLGRILRARSERVLPVFITTNLPLKGEKEDETLWGIYGGSITSLLREMTKAYQVIGPDRRRSE